MEDRFDNLSSACQRAAEFQTRVLVGDPVDAADRNELEKHLSSCPACLALQKSLSQNDQRLRGAYAGSRASSAFAARTLAALPAKPDALPATPIASAPRVFATGQARSPWAPRLSIAAAFVAAVLVTWAATYWKGASHSSKNSTLSLRRGVIVAPDGKSVTQLKPGTVYKVQADSVLPLTDASLLNVKEGAEFKVQVAQETGETSLKLQAGDLFAWGKSENDEKPLKVSCSTIDTLLHSGDFYVAEDGADEAGTVIIVFKGQAQVVRDNQTLPLRAGQVFYMLGKDEMAFAQTLELSDAVGRLKDDPGVRRQDLVDLRNLYEKQIKGYQKELMELDRLLKTEKNAQKLAELQKRHQLVVSYCDEHQRKLKTLFREFPYEELERGLHGHTDPSTWL